MSLNEEIIKIFIEGWLVKYHSFSLVNDQVVKNSDGVKIVLQLLNSRLELKDLLEERVVISIEIPEEMDSKDCISFAMKFYLDVVQVIEKEKL
ncbi:hypothetical protein [Acinetobacter indicus]|uniref:hypothetical protein n=1 Tax=Acinetobacter indicus TaxID=756892 RepID=UPI0025760445|nr:hypothetical protein [Acinetobacter indicus]MDM1769979.1 hypothetical protein [Acinetobacter indicus]MDM1773019.1 hypothetical protein [Acinetobacter indicus]